MTMKRNNLEDSAPWGSRESFWSIFYGHDVTFIFSGLIEEYDKEAKKLGELQLGAISDWLVASSNQNQFGNSF